MVEAKTQPTELSVEDYLAAIADLDRRADCAVLVQLMQEVTCQPAVMWGTSIVGFGQYHYVYESGRRGTACLTGFSSRKGDISVYLVARGPRQETLLTSLGQHKMGKACLSIRRMSDIDLAILKALVEDAVSEVLRRYGGHHAA